MDIAYALRLERDSKTSAALYDWSQVRFSYNSNHMEGSTITLGQTNQIYHEGVFLANKDQVIRSDDQIETANHFKLFDYMLNTVDQPLSVKYILHLQSILKHGTSDEDNPLKVVGGFKKIDNIIQNDLAGDTEVSSAKNAEHDLKELIHDWENTKHDQLEDYASFHYCFENIHPFSDGNGRIGRMLLFKERWRHRKMPFIISDENRMFYIRGLSKFKSEPGYLVGTLGQSLDEYTSAVQQVYGEKYERLPQPKTKASNKESLDPNWSKIHHKKDR